jgi:hypothetical protein
MSGHLHHKSHVHFTPRKRTFRHPVISLACACIVESTGTPSALDISSSVPPHSTARRCPQRDRPVPAPYAKSCCASKQFKRGHDLLVMQAVTIWQQCCRNRTNTYVSLFSLLGGRLSKGGNMLRSILLAVTISLLAGSVPAFAQIKSCNEWCLANRCGVGSMNRNECMRRCVPACQQKNPKTKS